MELAKKLPAFLYLDKNGFYFYASGLNQVLSLAFLITSVRDMDVVNGGSLMTQVKGFIDQYQIPPSTVTVILSPNITFEKDVIGFEKEAKDEEVTRFLETVPFDNVLSKEYMVEKGVKVIACNEDLYLELKMSFEKCGFTVDNAVPFQLLGQDQSYIRNLTPENASQLAKRLDRLKQVTILTVDKEKFQIIQTSEPVKEGAKPKKINTRLFAMIGVFTVLFVILGYMILTMK